MFFIFHIITLNCVFVCNNKKETEKKRKARGENKSKLDAQQKYSKKWCQKSIDDFAIESKNCGEHLLDPDFRVAVASIEATSPLMPQ